MKELCKIVSKKEIYEGLFDLWLQTKDIAKLAGAGQFVHIAVDNALMRRPISICDVKDDCIRIVFEVRGKGTKWLSEQAEGEYLDVLGPLGNGFTLLDKDKKAVFIGGGIGIFPLLYTAKHYGENSTVFLGFNNCGKVALIEDFKAIGAKLDVCTDDGSYCNRGFVTEYFDKYITENKPDIIYACGPLIMIKKVAMAAEKHGILCEVSMEERMGCGIGACLVCSCATKTNDGFTYKRVCKDGPVFNAREVIWDD